MQLSYWEIKSWFQNIDFTIVGSGIVGLNCALGLKEKFPKSKILILEKGILPSGASTKNAGFACFGSISEILDDLNSHTEEEVIQLVKKRVEGLNQLRNNIGDKNLGFKQNGGYELFRKEDVQLWETCQTKLQYINTLLSPIFPKQAFENAKNTFGFKNVINTLVFTPYEGQIDTGMMMTSLIKKAFKKGILIINGVSVTGFNEEKNYVNIQLNNQLEFKTHKFFIATNGFANEIINENIQPARAQVVITKPIRNLKIKGNFHLDKGFNYFRNINGRILFGGGRNLDFETEETTKTGVTEKIQHHLEKLLVDVILPKTPFEIDYRWSGIMGIGPQKYPIVKQLSEHVYCGIRLGGMGVAIGTSIGKDLAELI